MEILIVIVLAVVAYLMGSFSSALWYGKWFHGIDIREHGSKNAGSTNVLRVLGWKCAIPVFVTDVLKSFIPAMFFVMLLNLVMPELSNEYVVKVKGSEVYYLLQLLFGMMAIVGHIFPIFSGFKGGKGVASMLGIVLALDPLAAALALAVFIIVVICTKIVSVSSMSAGVSFPIIVFVMSMIRGNGYSITLTVFSIIVAILLLVTHKKNIKRLIKGEEPKISVGKKKE